MSRGPITGELRDAMGTDHIFCDVGGLTIARNLTITQPEFDRICDAIDAVNACLERENAELRERVAVLDNERGNMRETDAWKLGYDEGFASADDWLAQHEDAMAKHGWVKGPLDADGEMWRSGDMSDSNWGVIEGIAYEDGRWFVSGHDTSAPWVPADSIRHHHAPTVEDVLREMHAELDEVTALYVGEAIDSDERDRDEARIFAEYAAKLRLAGSDAE